MKGEENGAKLNQVKEEVGEKERRNRHKMMTIEKTEKQRTEREELYNKEGNKNEIG